MRHSRPAAVTLATLVVLLATPAPPTMADAAPEVTVIVTLDAAAGDTTQAATEAVEAAGGTVAAARAISDRSVAVSVVGTTGTGAQSISNAVADAAGVTAAQPSRRVRAADAATPNDPYFPQQWNLTGPYGVDALPAWSTSTGADVVVGVVDSGITRHPDLGTATSIVDGNVKPGYDFITDPTSAGDGDGRDNDPTDKGDYDSSDPSSWHGTHVAGIIAAIRNNGIGIAGLAPSATIEPLRVLGRDGGSEDDIIAAVSWGAGIPVEGLPNNPHPASVLNLSLAGGGYSVDPRDYVCTPALQTAIDAAVDRGVAIVVAAGNAPDLGKPPIPLMFSFPANCKNVIRVVASDANGMIASYSDYGTAGFSATIAAPGDKIISTVNDGTTDPANPAYTTMDGTSMAAPHVSAAIALLRSIRPNLTVAQLVGLLTSTAKAPKAEAAGGSCTRLTCGAGIVDAAAALAAVDDPASLDSLVVSLATPTIGGTARVRSQLTGAIASRSPAEGVVSWQWLRDGAPIAAATSARYTPTSTEKDASISVRVTVRSFGRSATQTSAAVKIAGLPFGALARPSISGTYRVGRKLTAKAGAASPSATGKLYQWLRGGRAIPGATGRTYRLTKRDRRKKIALTVTVTRTGYVNRSATSAAHKVK